MKLPRYLWALFAAGAMFATFGAAEARAQVRFLYYSPRVPYVLGPAYAPIAPIYPYSYHPYLMNYPSFGVLPAPFITGAWLYGYEQGAAAQNDDYIRDPFNTPPRKRDTLYPAVPFQKPPGDRFADLRRVRFEIAVPREEASVLIDGVQTKQTGLSRVYLTPPMDEDRLFTSNFEVRWTDKAGKSQSVRRTFEFFAGETIRHTFK